MLKFKSEEERQKAISEVPEEDDAPVGIDLEDFMRENEAKLEEIMTAEIEEGEPTGEPIDEINEPTDDPINKELETPPAEPPVEDDKYTQLMRRNESLLNQRDELMASSNSRMEELEAKIEELKSNKDSNKEIPKTKLDDQITSVQNEIAKLEVDMNEDDPELNPYDADYIKNLRKTNKLSIKLNSLIAQKSAELHNQQKSEIDKLKNEQRLKRESNKKKESRENMISDIESFRKDHDELQGKSYREMDDVYTDFALEVASEYFGTPINKVTAKDTELAMVQYKNKTPALMEKLKTKGLTEPEDLDQFMTLSDVHFLKDGLILNKNTGAWEQLKDARGNKVTFPNHKAAYTYYQELNGLKPNKEKENFEKQQKSNESLVNAINQRADVTELDSDHKKVDIGEMTKEEATKMIENTDEEKVAMRARRNYDDPLVSEYNKALAVLGYATIKRDDV